MYAAHSPNLFMSEKVYKANDAIDPITSHQRSTDDRMWASNPIKKKLDDEDMGIFIYFWQKLSQKKNSLSSMWALFEREKVYKNHLWMTAEKVQAKLEESEVIKVFNFLDKGRKGYFTFHDFVIFSKAMQGFEID